MGTTVTPGSNSRGDPASRQSSARTPHLRSRYQFGPFEFRPGTGELWKHGVRVKLQSKPAQVLEALLEHPSELVTREAIRHRLWPEGTYVDFEGGINTATNRLRAVLADCPDNPTYIETIPRLGYRFIYPLPEPAPPPAEVAADIPAEVIATNVPLARLEYMAPALNRFSRPMIIAAVFASVVLIAGVAALHTLRRTRRAVEPEFQQLTFHADNIASARFMPNLKSVAYTALHDGTRNTSVLDTADLHSQSVEAAPGLLTAISHGGDLIFVSREGKGPADWRLLELRAATHDTEKLADGAVMADSSPINSEFAIVRRDGPASVVEFPRGHVVFTSLGWITDLRISPSGDRVALIEHPVRDDDAGYVRVVDRTGRSRVLTPFWSSAAGLAWLPSGAEIWFSASKDGTTRAIYAVSGGGKMRLVFQGPSSLRVMDFAPSGKLLAALDDERMTLFTGGPEAVEELDASQYDCSHVDGISADGKLLLFTECGTAVGRHYTSYLRDLKSRTTRPLSSGRGLDLSADGEWAITIDPQDRKSVTLRRTSSPDFRVLSGGFEYQWAKFLPGDQELLAGGSFPGQPLKIYRQTLRDGRLREVRGIEYMDDVMVSGVDTKVGGLVGNQLRVFDWSTGKLLVSSQAAGQWPVGWSGDGHAILAVDPRKMTIVKLDVCSGKSENWKSIKPQNAGGFAGLAGVVAVPEAGAYAYSARFSSSRLYLVSGLS